MTVKQELKFPSTLFFSFIFGICIIWNQQVSAQIYPLKPDKVPEKIKKTLARNYKSVTVVAWMMEGENYTAIFKDDSRSMTVSIDPKGNILHRYYAIPRNTIPKQVWKTAEKQKVETYRPDGFGRGMMNQKDSIFLIEGQKNKERLFLFINDDGKVLKKYLINVDAPEQ
jgi:hypothetical protein